MSISFFFSLSHPYILSHIWIFEYPTFFNWLTDLLCPLTIAYTFERCPLSLFLLVSNPLLRLCIPQIFWMPNFLFSLMISRLVLILLPMRSICYALVYLLNNLMYQGFLRMRLLFVLIFLLCCLMCLAFDLSLHPYLVWSSLLWFPICVSQATLRPLMASLSLYMMLWRLMIVPLFPTLTNLAGLRVTFHLAPLPTISRLVFCSKMHRIILVIILISRVWMAPIWWPVDLSPFLFLSTFLCFWNYCPDILWSLFFSNIVTRFSVTCYGETLSYPV